MKQRFHDEHNMEMTYSNEDLEVYRCACGHYSIIWKKPELLKRPKKSSKPL